MKLTGRLIVLLLAFPVMAAADRPTGLSIIRADYENARHTTQTAHFKIYHDCVPDQNCIDFNRFEQTHDVIVEYFTKLGLSLRTINRDSKMRIRIFDDWETREKEISAVGLRINMRAAIFDSKQNCVFFVAKFLGPPGDPGLQEAYLRTVLQHETTHQVLTNLGVVSFGVIYPFWISEGLACLFEVPLPCCQDDRIPVNDLRLADVGSPKELPRIKFLVSEIGTWEGKAAHSPQEYAQAWALAHFLMHRRRDEMRTFLQKIMAVEPDEGQVHYGAIDEFETAFGPADDKLDKEWREYVADLLARAKKPDPVVPPPDADAAP